MKKRFLLFIVAMSTMGLLQASSNPSLSRVYGNQFTPEVSQTQLAGAVGTLDGTFGSGGMLSVASGQYAVATQALNNGSVVVLSDDASNSYLAQYTAEGAVTWSVTLTGLSGTTDFIMIDAQGRFYVAGSDDGTGSHLPWIRRVTAAGSVDGTFTFADGASWIIINQIAQQTSGEIIAVGLRSGGTPYAQVARYNLNGSLDNNVTTGFGVTHSGYAILNGSNSLPTSGNILYSVVVDSSNNIYVSYIDATPHVNVLRLTSAGLPDTGWAAGSSSTVHVAYLDGVPVAGRVSSLRMIIDSLGDLVLASLTSGGNILAASITSANGSSGTFANFSLKGSALGGTDTFDLKNLVASSDGTLYLVGSDLTTNYMMVVACTSAGILDTAFNPSAVGPAVAGVNFFRIGTPTVNALLYSGSIASDGQLYVAGSQSTGGGPTITPYVTRLYNSPYVTQVAQFPAAQEQGILDQTFGATGTETYAGITTPINGLYGSLLKQRATTAIEMTVSGGAITQGDIVIGMNGMTNASSNANMMLAFLTQEGAVDTAMNSGGTPGYLTLANASASNEYMTSMIEDALGNIYISGYTSSSSTPTAPGNAANTSAFLRSYATHSSLSGSAVHTASQATTGYQGVGLSLQNNRTLLCVAESATVGHITSYISGTLDTSFGDADSGTISATSYGLHMGLCYGLAIDANDFIYAAYVDSVTSLVTVVKFQSNGAALVPTFGIAGIVATMFPGQTTVNPSNVRIGFVATGDIAVAAVTATGILVAYVNTTTGAVDFSTVTPITITGSTSLQLSKVTGVSDGTALLTFWDNAANDTMYVARMNASAALDTTFNSQGSQEGVLPIQIGSNLTTRTASSALVQSVAGANQGNIIVAGYESVTTSDATPMAMRVYGDVGTIEILDYPLADNAPGTFEAAYNITSTIPSITAGAGNVIFTYPSTNANNGLLLIGIDNGTTSIVARVHESDMTVATGFNGSTGYVTIAGSLRGISTISVDANNNILVGGTSGGAGWAKVINNAGSSTTAFNMPGNVAAVNTILQQESGRYIVAGTETSSGKGLLVAFQDVASSGAFQVDASFNPLSVGSAAAGSFYVGTTGLYAMAINANDTIAAAYSVSGTVNIVEITADGSGLVFGPTATSVTTDSSATVRLNIDGSQNIVVGGSIAASHQVKVQRFDSAGGTSTAFTGTGVVSGVQTITNLGSAGVTLTGLMATTTQQTVFVGYNSAGGNGALFAVRLTTNGSLDLDWNATPTAPDTAGVLTYAADSAIDINGSSIAVDGTILSIGATSLTDSASAPIATKVIGDALVVQIAQDPLQSPCGTLDLTIPGNVSGALALSGLVIGVPVKIYEYTATVNSSPNGAMLIASTDSTHVYLTQLNQDLTKNSANFGTTGVVTLTPNSGTSPTSVTVTDMYVANGTNDTAQPIYLAGYTTNTGVNTPFAVQVASNGSGSPVYVSPASSLTVTGCVRQSSNSRVLVSGYNGASGAIVAYNSAMTAIDTSFNNGSGYYTTGVATGIYAMTTDNFDRIYIAYANAGGTNIIVQRLLENGTAVDSTFTASFPVTGTYPTGVTTQIKMAIDLTNNMLVVAAQNGASTSNVVQVARFNYAGGTVAAGAVSTVTVTGKALSLADLIIDANQNIYVIGNNTTDSKAIVARILSNNSTTITLDTTYAAAVSPAPAGIANIAVGAGLMTLATAGMLDTDGRVYLVGSGSGNGYMGRLFNNQYYMQTSPAILQGVVGTLDLTLDASNTGGIDLSLAATTSTAWHTALSGVAKAQAIIENQNGDGSSFIAFVVSGNLIVGKLNADMVPATFGTNGLTTAVITMSAVNSITQDASGNIIVAGANSSLQKVVLFNSSGALQATFSAPTLASTVGTTVAQQKSGRYIVGGYDGSANGLVSAYKNSSAISGSALAVDLTFGPAGSNGYYPTGVNAQIDDLIIDSNDYIYIVYRNGSAVNVAKLTPEGSLSTSANTPSAQLWAANPITAVSSPSLAITATQPARIAINQAGSILVGASTSAGFSTQLYNGSTGVAIGSLVAQTFSNTPVLTKLVGSIGSTTPNNEFYGAMYTTAPAAVVFAITSAGALDMAGFNASSGYLSTNVASVTQVHGLAIQADGKVVMVGYNGTSSPDPVLIRAYGYPYVSQYAQAPEQIAAGILDTTLWPTSGALELDTYAPISTTITTLAGSQVARIYEYPAGGANNGKALLLFTNTNSNADSVLARINKDLTLDTTFNSPAGFITLAGKNNATSLFVDSSSNIYVAGGTTTSWIYKYANNGTVPTPWATPSTNLSAGAFQVGVQSFGRIILAGKDTYGTLLGYNTSGVLDTTFGTGGVVTFGTVTDAITDFTIDSADTIITVKTTSGSTVLQRVSVSGTTITPLNGGTAIANAIGNAKVIIDAAGNIVVATATTTGFSLRRYNNNDTATNNGSLVTIPAGSSTAFLGNIYATSDGKVALVGSEPTLGLVVARLTSAFALDTTAFNATTGYLITNDGAVNVVNDGIICGDDRIMVAGTNSGTPEPYLARVFGDNYVTYISQALASGIPGTLDTSFGSGTPTTGYYNLATLGSGALNNSKGEAILSLSAGGYYMVVDNNTNSLLMKTLVNGSLDPSYNSGGAGGYPAGIAQSNAPTGVNSMMMNGSNQIMLVGTNGSGGWVQRYTSGSSGSIDTTFATATSNVLGVGSGTTATVAVEQTLGRLVVAGINASGKGALFAYKSLAPSGTPGTIDTTFNATVSAGTFTTGVSRGIYTLIADQYDRLIFAALNVAGNNVNLYRLTPSGEPDVTFGSSGIAGNIFGSTPNDTTQIRIGLNAAGNIVVAACTTTGIAITSFDNGISTTAGANGSRVNAELVITSLTAPTLTALVNTADGDTLILGNQSGTNGTWVARLLLAGSSAVALDTTNFNPAAIGGIAGIFQYAGAGTTAHVYNAMVINYIGELGVLGYENSSGTFTPSLLQVYDDPYTTEEIQSPNSKPVGNNDVTLGVSPTATTAKGITFFGGSGNAASGQVARAIALQDDNNIVVAIDGNTITGPGVSGIMINMFDNDGIPNSGFGTSGTATALAYYSSQYVKDMVTFTTPSNVHKAILAGYATNSGAGITGSLVLQYILNADGTPGDSHLDSSFGGFNGNPSGVAFGDGYQAFVVGQQTSGRVVVGGLAQGGAGLLLGYTSTGKLDLSFGNSGYQATSTGGTGIYTHAIDSQNRIVIAYNNAGTLEVARFLEDGSGLDSTFGTAGLITAANITGLQTGVNNNFKVVVDGSGNVIVAAITGDGTTSHIITVYSYVPAGTSTNATASFTAGTGFPGTTSSTFEIGRLLADTQGNVIVVAYDSQPTPNTILVTRLVSALTLDTSFNGSGYLTYEVAPGNTQVVTDALIHPDGRIIVVGNEE